VQQDHPKLSRRLLRSLDAIHDPCEELPLIVRYASRQRIMRHGGPLRGVRQGYHYHLRPFVHMHATVEGIQALESDPAVTQIHPDLPVHAYLDASLPHIRVPMLWQEHLTGQGIRVAVVDSGIDFDHPDFTGRIIEAADFTGTGPGDRHGHGTHCAGVLAGSGAMSDGHYRGVAPDAELFIAKVLHGDGQGMMSDVMMGLEWAVEQGVQVISLSLGGPGPCDGTDALSETCEAAVERGVVVVVAAGNDGPTPYSVGSPGCAAGVITVGAASDLDRIAAFSSRGPTADGRTKPDVVLPGVEIIAPRATATTMGTPIDDWYTASSGTSMATPHAAGLAALLLQAEPDLTPIEIKSRLMRTAIDLGAPANAQGAGRVDAWRAYTDETGDVIAPEPQPVPAPANPGCLALIATLLLPHR
jgi:serine protease AprX